jgi:hypothetical protein
LLQVVLAVPDNTLAFLYYRGEVPADPAIEQIRRDFTAFCEANLFYSDWRQAWGGFVAAHPAPVLPMKPTVNLPAWRQRWRQRLGA